MGKRDLTFLAVITSSALLLLHYLRAPIAETQSTVVRLVDSAPSAERIAEIDWEFQNKWDERKIATTALADPLQVARRISLALTGTIPSLEEIRALESDLRSHSREEVLSSWADHLLEDRRSANHLAERLARVLVGIEQEPFLVYRRHRFVSWLSDRLHDNTPYDTLVRTLLTAEGLWTDSPEVNFLTVTIGGNAGDRPDEIKLASRASRAFLGVRLDCMQCHDDNLQGDWLQTDFHELAAYFSEASPTIVGVVDKPRDYEYKYLDADDTTVVRPDVPFADDLLSASGNRRQQLANWVTHPGNRAFSRAIVNRAWGLAFGVPLVEPVDSIPLEGPYPPGMESLVDEFIDSGFDLRRLWHSIFASAAFQRDSRAEEGVTRKQERHFAAFPLTRLRPEQVAGAILQSAQLKTIDAHSHVVLRLARLIGTSEFVTSYGDMGADEFASDGGTIPQRLVMLNGKMVKERTREDWVGNASTRIVDLSANTKDAIDNLYLTILTRRPSDEEREHFEALRNETYKDQKQRWAEHVAWTLINTTEFSWNH